MREINSFLDSELVQRTRQWRQLKTVLDHVLPPEFLERVSYASLADGTLTIFSDAPEWTSRIRFYAADLIEVFGKRGQKISNVQARTVPKPEARPTLDPGV